MKRDWLWPPRKYADYLSGHQKTIDEMLDAGIAPSAIATFLVEQKGVKSAGNEDTHEINITVNIKKAQRDKGKFVPDPDYEKIYYAARREHAWRTRKDREVYKKVAARLGVSAARARQMAHQHRREEREPLSEFL